MEKRFEKEWIEHWWDGMKNYFSDSQLQYYSRWLNTNPNVTWDIIQQHPEFEWDFAVLSNHPKITWDIIQAHPDKKWLYHC